MKGFEIMGGEKISFFLELYLIFYAIFIKNG